MTITVTSTSLSSEFVDPDLLSTDTSKASTPGIDSSTFRNGERFHRSSKVLTAVFPAIDQIESGSLGSKMIKTDRVRPEIRRGQPPLARLDGMRAMRRLEIRG
jgi:hypothetical protein